MNKSELLEKIKEKNEELDSLNKELKEITAEENAKNLGKCFKQHLYSGLYIYHKIVQITYEYGNYKVLTVSGSDISIRYWSVLEDSESNPCSVEEFDKAYNEVINGALANKVIK